MPKFIKGRIWCIISERNLAFEVTSEVQKMSFDGAGLGRADAERDRPISLNFDFVLVAVTQMCKVRDGSDFDSPGQIHLLHWYRRSA
ncbi:unnamed protein product [Strongylus vulgaris]|uniref:Uncharacterized protein n=1 Tax=Strongylus vulgaris TaxID=40348 RepID=A0A3P7IPZ6_STRVU|nr:unnamed protein product [Strongylus vulgaris]